MATNYTVVLFSRQHLGNDAGAFNDVEPDVAFAGRAKDIPFDCPGINTAETAVMMFQSRDVDHQGTSSASTAWTCSADCP